MCSFGSCNSEVALNFQRTLLFSWLAERGGVWAPVTLSWLRPLSSVCAIGNRLNTASEIRGGKNRESEWESSRWDDIMCTAAKLQQHRNKGSHSSKAMTQTHKTFTCYEAYILSHAHKCTWLTCLPSFHCWSVYLREFSSHLFSSIELLKEEPLSLSKPHCVGFSKTPF